MRPRQRLQAAARQSSWRIVAGVDEAWMRARAVAESQHWLLTSEQAQAVGLTRSQVGTQVRSGRWLPLLRGVYLLDADMYDGLPEENWWRAALLAHGQRACLVGRTAAKGHGAQGLPWDVAEIDIAVVDGVSRPPRDIDLPGTPVDGPTVVVRQWPVRENEVVTVAGMRMRRPDLSVVDAALQLDRVHALCLFDWALHAQLMTSDELAAIVAAATRRPGVIHTRFAASIADGRAQSPLESRVRLACIDGDLPPDDLQYEVRDRWEQLVAVGDLVWFRHRRRPLIAEADGESVHGLPKPVFHDRRRGNALTIQACDQLRFTWADALRPIHIQQVVRAALAA